MMMRIVVAVVAAVLISSCTSVPLSALGRGASFNENTFGFLDARALRVKVSLPEGFVLDMSSTQLTAIVQSSGGTRRTQLALQPVSASPGTRGGGMWSTEMAVTAFEMDLTEDSVRDLRELQGFVASGKVKDVDLQVKVQLKQAPPGATSVKVWIDLLMSPIEGYFPLIDGGTIAINQTTTYGPGK